MISLTLPYPPTANHYLGSNGNRRYIKPAGKRYRQTVCEIVAELGINAQYGKLAMFITVFPPDRRKRDISNIEKFMTDSLQAAGVFEDDYHIDALAIMRDEVVKGGMVKVVICAAGSPKSMKLVDLVGAL